MNTSARILALTIAIGSSCGSLAYAQSDGITRTPWQMNRGEGIIRATSPLKNTGDPAALTQSKIPKVDAEGWGKPPTDAQGNISVDEKSKLGTCNTELDFTYFQTLLSVPAGSIVTDSKVTFSYIDDLAQIHIYNSVNSHTFGPISGRNTHTADLSKFIATGEINRIVITQVDTCKVKNTIKNIQIKIAGNVVETNEQVVSTAVPANAERNIIPLYPPAGIPGLALKIDGALPFLEATCLNGESIALIGVHNIEGQLKLGEGASSFQHSCLNTQINQDTGVPVLSATCRTSSGQMLESSVALTDTISIKKLILRVDWLDCSPFPRLAGEYRHIPLAQVTVGTDIRESLQLGSSCKHYLDQPSPVSKISHDLIFTNRSNEDRLIAWISFDKVPLAITTLPPGRSFAGTSYENHRFLILNSYGNCLAMHGVGNHNYEFNIK